MSASKNRIPDCANGVDYRVRVRNSRRCSALMIPGSLRANSVSRAFSSESANTFVSRRFRKICARGSAIIPSEFVTSI